MYVLYLFFVNTVHYRRKQICIEGLISQGHLLGHPSQTSQIITSLQIIEGGLKPPDPPVATALLSTPDNFTRQCQ